VECKEFLESDLIGGISYHATPRTNETTKRQPTD
jgi:hypothetical protein